jgi:hypothetical protein
VINFVPKFITTLILVIFIIWYPGFSNKMNRRNEEMSTEPEMDIEELRSNCNLAQKLWGRTFSGLGAMTNRLHGETAIKKLWTMLLGQHQKGFYKDGLRKLGISDGEPPAVVAAKYHYFTNMIGGPAIQYIEETPKKVWIRYTAPMWTYAGVTMLALPASLRRSIFSGWHPYNGKMMGCPRLGWVATKFIMEGQPYDEGYFIEYEHDLLPGEEMRYERVLNTPEFDPAKAPILDPELWPESRILKARRNWSREYVRTTVDCLFQMFGEIETHYIVQQTMRGLATQYIHELTSDMGIHDTTAQGITEIFANILKACDQEYDVHHVNDSTSRIELRSFRPFMADEASEELRAACFHFQQVAAWILNGRVSVTRHPNKMHDVPSAEEWEITDTGKWLY